MVWLVTRNVVHLAFAALLVAQGLVPSPVAGMASLWVLALVTLPHFTWTALAFAVGLIAESERKRREELAELHEALRSAQLRLADRARLEERFEVARELHDSVGHHLAALNVQLELARHLEGAGSRAAVAEAHGLGRLLLSEVRDVVATMRTERALDLPSALEQLAKVVPTPKVCLSIEQGLTVSEPASAHALYRCAQELVTNSVRHAEAQHVWLELKRRDGGLSLRVHDDGRGSEAPVWGHGLRGIHERAQALHGEVSLQSAPGSGFSLELWLPEVGA